MKLIANEIGLDEEDDILILGFKGDGESNYLFLSQNMDEIELDGKSLYLEVKDQKHGGYGLIDELKFDSKKLEFRMNKKGLKIIKSELIEILIINGSVKKVAINM